MKKISVDWKRKKDTSKERLSEYRLYLKTLGLKENTISLYDKLINNYLLNSKTDVPSPKYAEDFYNSLHERNMSRSSINNYAAAIIKYHDMIKRPVKLKFLRSNNSLPYYFEQADILRLFNACGNIKHYAMLKVLFFGCLRSGELCKLDIQDYNPEKLTLRLNDTKNGSDAIIFIDNETAEAINQYLQIRPTVDTNALFITDYSNRWSNGDVWRMFKDLKKKAGVKARGGVHGFSRHSPATLMIAKGCDLRSVQAILRHRDINTTLRYTHLSDDTRKDKIEKYLLLS